MDKSRKCQTDETLNHSYVIVMVIAIIIIIIDMIDSKEEQCVLVLG